MPTHPPNTHHVFDRTLSLDLDRIILGLESPRTSSAWRAWLRVLKGAAERQIPQGAVYTPKELRR